MMPHTWQPATALRTNALTGKIQQLWVRWSGGYENGGYPGGEPSKTGAWAWLDLPNESGQGDPRQWCKTDEEMTEARRFSDG